MSIHTIFLKTLILLNSIFLDTYFAYLYTFYKTYNININTQAE